MILSHKKVTTCKSKVMDLILQIIISGGDLYLKGYNGYKENAFTLFKKRMEITRNVIP